MSLVVLALVPAGAAFSQDTVSQADQEALREAIVGYVKAINARDAAAAAAHWGEDGVWIDPQGHEVTGVDAIREHLKEAFEAGTMPVIELEDINVRFVAPGVATEEGHVILTRGGMPPERSTYLSIHKKTDGGWKLFSVRQTVMPEPVSNYTHLQQLEWMIGDWVDQEGELTVTTHCDWVTNRNFLIRTFRATHGDEVEMEGTQIIGWDAERQGIRSWVFDSDGGFGQGSWNRDGNTWVVESRFQDAGGLKGSSVNHYRYVDADTFTYSSSDRVFDGESLPDVETITIKRQAAAQDQGADQ